MPIKLRTCAAYVCRHGTRVAVTLSGSPLFESLYCANHNGSWLKERGWPRVVGGEDPCQRAVIGLPSRQLPEYIARLFGELEDGGVDSKVYASGRRVRRAIDGHDIADTVVQFSGCPARGGSSSIVAGQGPGVSAVPRSLCRIDGDHNLHMRRATTSLTRTCY